MKVAIGGNRLGSGNNMNTELHNYSRSTHNLSESFISSMAPGVLVPFMCKLGLNDDTFHIDLNAMVRTLPTIGPLFGSFKLQLDVFSVPIRLYQGILHNNPVNIGLKMNQVFLPKIQLETRISTMDKNTGSADFSQMSTNCLLKYLGLSGIGTTANDQNAFIRRKINAVPMLGYYDIFKCYYSNKQEEYAYVIGAETEAGENNIQKIEQRTTDGTIAVYSENEGFGIANQDTIRITGANLTRTILVQWDNRTYTLNQLEQMETITILPPPSGNEKTVIVFIWNRFDAGITIKNNPNSEVLNYKFKLTNFRLDNIDQMRNVLLSRNQLGDEVVLGADPATELSPYNLNWMQDGDTGKMYNSFPQNGLCVKTYQSDIYNNWVNSSWVDGENGINEITAVDTSDGRLMLDALLLKKKIYNLLNRVAVSGGTYQDWQEAVYGTKVLRMAETPMWYGGMSSEIVFEEVVSNSQTDNGTTPNDIRKGQLGGLAGKGTLVGKKGGHIEIDCNEPCFIIGIVSITPRICYTQGNEFYLTDISTIDDLHKPELDGIGFQNLMTEQMAWWSTVIQPNSDIIMYRGAIGKTPAWINYMTSVDKAFGDFADPQKAGYMVLGRNYGRNNEHVTDLTTYIDPQKFNYPFAYAELDAQNFWVNIHSNITARRKMSAKVIPNL